MIPKQEILEIATSNNLSAHVIEKDYVLGWILAGINQHDIGKKWVFKGGTCLKKCYFETYRFSEDLDFTLSDSAHINEKFLQDAFKEIGEWIYEHTGIEMPTKRMAFDIYENPRGVMSCQGKLFYRGSASPSSPQQMPRIKLDLSVDEVLVAPAVVNTVTHNYSDLPESGIQIQCYNYAEVFAEKTRALAERTRPRDLYVFNRDLLKGLFIDGQERATQTATEGILESTSQNIQDSLEILHTDSGNIDYSGTLLSGGLSSVGGLSEEHIREIINNDIFPTNPSNAQQSFPTPDSFLYFINSLPEGGTGVYGDSVYLNKDGAVSLLGNTSILDNDPNTNAYYDPADIPSAMPVPITTSAEGSP